MDSTGNTYNYLYAGRLFSRIGNDGSVYYHQNGLGSISVITDVYGAQLNRYTYDAFGSQITVNESIDNIFRFTGEIYDDSGLMYLRARYYDPAIGRFISKDTYSGQLNDPLSQNLYVYVGNNPVLYIDPTGHFRISRGLDIAQAGLDICGLVPAAGEFCDGANALIYLARGDNVNASLSAAAMIPFAGWGATGVKYGLKYGDDVVGIVKGTGKGELHHIASDKSLVSGFTAQYEKIFKNAGMSLQDDANLIFLEGHSGAHTKAYKQYVLDYITNATKGLKGDAAKDALTKALTDLKEQLIKNPQMPYKGGL